MEVSGQTNVPDSLPLGSSPLVPTEEKSWRDPQPVRTLWESNLDVQAVAHRYTDRGIPALNKCKGQ
jgi:hypothetical protein